MANPLATFSLKQTLSSLVLMAAMAGATAHADTREVETAYGSVSIDGMPERVVTLYEGALDAAIATGIKPVGAVITRTGLALGVAGALLQPPTHNPLAEPGLLGVSAGSAFAVSLAIFFGASTATLTTLVSQAGALAGCALVIAATRIQGVGYVLSLADIHKLPAREVARKLALLPQDNSAPEGLTVTDLTRFGRHPHQSWLSQWSEEDQHAVESALRPGCSGH